MTIKAQVFNPEVLLTLPRRSPGLPNRDGSSILFSTSTYSFKDHKSTPEVRVLDSNSKESNLVTDDKNASEPTWIDDSLILLLVGGDKGKTDVVIGDYDDFEKTKYVAGTVDAPASNVKIRRLLNDRDAYVFAITAQVDAKGELFNPENTPETHTSGKVYDSLFVRHWDNWVTSNRNAIFVGCLSRESSDTDDGQFKLSSLKNALADTKLESPIPPFGGGDHFDIGEKALVFVAKDPDLNPATHTKQNLYICHWKDAPGGDILAPQQVSIPGLEGATSSPTLSPDGKALAFVSMRKDGYESDKNQLLVIPDIHSYQWIEFFFTTPDGKGSWDRSPSGIAWSLDGKKLYLLAENEGAVMIYSTPSAVMQAKSLPQLLWNNGKNSVTDIKILDDGQMFVTASSMIDNSAFYTMKLDEKAQNVDPPKLISSNTKQGSTVNLSPHQVSDIWFEGAKGKKIHALVVRPSTFPINGEAKEKQFPLAYLIHGGPQGSWLNSWSTRWNPAVFAEQGYVVVCPNPTGSTGYGQALTDGIQGQWGGTPYEDLVKGFEYVEKNMSYVDTSRAVALGASYGGYMVNWIQGQELGRKFQALVTHDGVFSMAGQMASEELYFPQHEFLGSFASHRASWLKWDPSAHTDKWATPHLIIHSDKDYRLTISEGLSAFNALQLRRIKSKFLTFPDENHWVLKPENSLLWHTVVFDFINEAVGLPPYSNSKVSKALLEQATVVR